MAVDLVPFTHTPVLPGAAMNWTPLVAMIALAAVLFALSACPRFATGTCGSWPSSQGYCDEMSMTSCGGSATVRTVNEGGLCRPTPS